MIQSGIADKLNIEDLDPLEIVEEECVFNDNHDDDVKNDYQFIRRKLRKSVAASETILEQVLKNIKIDPSPRVVEGCSQIIRIMIDASRELQNIQEKQSKFVSKMKESGKIKEDGEKINTIKSSLNEIITELEDRENE